MQSKQPKAEAFPREKIIAFGAQALSDTELIAAILGNGIKSMGVLELSQAVVKTIDSRNGDLTFADLKAIRGLGNAQVSKLLAALEFSRRRIKPEGLKINTPTDILPLLQHLQMRKQECFVCISLNGAHEVIESRIVTIGLVNFCQVHPREVLADVICDRASAIVIAHNHPSGSLIPSQADKDITQRIKSAAEIIGIQLLDHVIISKRGYFSFKEQTLL